MNKYR